MREFILGTDFATDCDDAAAIRILVRAARQGKLHLSAVVLNVCLEQSAAALRAFLRAEGTAAVPVGLDRGSRNTAGWRSAYHPRLAALCPGMTNDSPDVADGAQLYIDVLRAACGPVEIAEIGHLQVLDEALHREPELFRRKVARVWVMGGRWDVPHGREYNFTASPEAIRAAHRVLRDCPCPMTFLGFEVGASVITGGSLREDDILGQIYRDSGRAGGRSSWDPLLTEAAASGDPAALGYRVIRGRASADPETGENSFIPDENGPHAFLVKAMPDAAFAARVDGLIASE